MPEHRRPGGLRYGFGVFIDRTGTPLQAPYAGTTNYNRVGALARTRVVRAAATGPGLSVAVLNLDRPDLILPMTEAAADIQETFAQRGLGFELLIGDTGSTHPEVLTMLAQPPTGVRCVPDLTYHFSRTNNELCDGRVRFDHLLLLNNDVLARTAEPLLALVDGLDAHSRVGIVGAVLDFPDGSVQHAGVDLVRAGPLRGLPIHLAAKSRRPHSPGESWRAVAVTGAALMIRTSLWEQLGGLDEAYARECQDIDLCLRAHRLGWGTRVVDVGALVHEENGTRPKGEEDWADRRLFLRRWWSYLEAVFL